MPLGAATEMPSPQIGHSQAAAQRFATRRRSVWLHPMMRWLVAGLMLVALILFASHRVLGSSGGADGYSVTVPVTLLPYDPQIWSMVNAENFDEAAAIDPDLPNPTAIPVLGEVTESAPPPNSAQLQMEAYTGPAAQRYVFRGATSTDTARAHYCLTAAIYYEAASESEDGMRGVAQVILNRARHPSFPGTICGVVFQGSQRAIVCQFTFSCDGSMARTPNAGIWARASRIAAEALAGRTFPAVGLATHYHTKAVWPSWGRTLAMTNVIGAHIFHRWRGRYGTPAAFSRPYSGHEPVPGPYLPISAQLAARAGRSVAPSYANVAPVPAAVGIPTTPAGQPDAATMAAIAAARSAPQTQAIGTPPVQPSGMAAAPVAPMPPRGGRREAEQPSYADPRLAGSGSIREEYRNSGAPIAR